MDSDEENSKEKRKHIVIKNSTDLQRMKLEKLMKNPVSIVYVFPNSNFIQNKFF